MVEWSLQNPVPKEHELSKDYIDTIIEEAVKDSIDNGISGKTLHLSFLKQSLKNRWQKLRNKY